MGYFSNGTEHMMYEEEYCDNCINQNPDSGGCAVMLAHMLYNYDECDNPDSILHLLIPRANDGVGNKKCTMYREDTA